jgi:hypothetical protein
VRDLARPIAVSGGGGYLAVLANHERGGSDFLDPALIEVPSICPGQEPPQLGVTNVEQLDNGQGVVRVKVFTVEIGQGSRAEHVGNGQLAAKRLYVSHRGGGHCAKSFLHDLRDVPTWGGGDGGAVDDDKTCPARRAKRRPGRYSHADDWREGDWYPRKALPYRAGARRQRDHRHDLMIPDGRPGYSPRPRGGGPATALER